MKNFWGMINEKEVNQLNCYYEFEQTMANLILEIFKSSQFYFAQFQLKITLVKLSQQEYNKLNKER